MGGLKIPNGKPRPCNHLNIESLRQRQKNEEFKIILICPYPIWRPNTCIDLNVAQRLTKLYKPSYSFVPVELEF